MLLRQLVLLVGLLGATTADAGFYTGSILYGFMTSQVVGESGAAIAYVAGVADADELLTSPRYRLQTGRGRMSGQGLGATESRSSRRVRARATIRCAAAASCSLPVA